MSLIQSRIDEKTKSNLGLVTRYDNVMSEPIYFSIIKLLQLGRHHLGISIIDMFILLVYCDIFHAQNIFKDGFACFQLFI